jgi:eukaryotic-like serine/threonine-protein kinase
VGKPILFGNYYLLERINVGGMAEVFKAKAVGVEGFERLVAVKRILPNIAEDQEFISMFIDEAKIAVQLNHANIAQIFDLGRVEESYFIALEYVPGKDLRAIFNHARLRSEPVPMAMACYVIMRVCEALGYAHSKNDAQGNPLHFVHRDVSPQNILISYDGEVKVIDFGIAKAAGKASKTRAGILKGKFGYMSPEQVNGAEIDLRSDVFGVGICLYEILTGERLFTGESDFSTVEKVRKVDIMPPSTYNRRVPEELEQIVLKALARDPEDRYQTAIELHDELQSFTFTSNNTFSRKELSGYMHKVFADEIEQEAVHDREYDVLDLPEPASSEFGFEEKTPQRSFFSGIPKSQPKIEEPSNFGNRQPIRRVPTILGMPKVNLSPESRPPDFRRKTAVPPLVPAKHSIPQRHSPAQPTSLVMEWDEDMSTQIYDRPDGTPLPGLPESLNGYPHDNGFKPQMPKLPKLPIKVETVSRADSSFRTPRIEEEPFPVSFRPRTPWKRYFVMLLGAAAAVAIAVAGGFFALAGEPNPAIIQLSTVPKDAVVRFDNRQATGSSSPFVILDVKPNIKHTLEVSKSGYESISLDVTATPDQIKQLPDLVLRPLESGFTVDSVPTDANVFVDGKELAQRTPAKVSALSAGPHQVRIEQDGFAPWETQIHVTGGIMLNLPSVTLVPKAPAVRQTAARVKKEVDAKTDAEAADSKPRRKPVVLLAKGTLRIDTRPQTQVFIDGALVGNTPQTNPQLEPGLHQVRLYNAELNIEKSFSVDIPPGETVVKSMELVPEP